MSGIRCSRRSAQTPATLGLVTFHTPRAIGGSACQTLARFTTGEAALLDCAEGEGRGAGARVRSRQSLERFSAARDVRAVRARGVALSGERPRPCRSTIWSPTRRPACRARRGLRRSPTRRAGQPARVRIAVNVDPARAIRRGCRRTNFSGGDAAEGRRRFESAARPAAGRRQHLWRYVLAAMALLLAAEGRARRRGRREASMQESTVIRRADRRASGRAGARWSRCRRGDARRPDGRRRRRRSRCWRRGGPTGAPVALMALGGGCRAAGRRRADLVPGAAAPRAVRQPGGALHRGARAVARRRLVTAVDVVAGAGCRRRWPHMMLADAVAAVVGGRRRRHRAARVAAPRRLPGRGRGAWRSCVVLFVVARPGAPGGRRRVAGAVSRSRHPRRDAGQRPGEGRHAAGDRGAPGRQPRAGDRAGAARRRRSLAGQRDDERRGGRVPPGARRRSPPRSSTAWSPAR